MSLSIPNKIGWIDWRNSVPGPGDRDLAVERDTFLHLYFLAQRHLDDRRNALVPAIVSHKLDDERPVWRPAERVIGPAFGGDLAAADRGSG
jgi:hypothetical protein